MATLSVIWWRDIPAQVIAKDGRRSSKVVLHPRFQVAIDKAAEPRRQARLQRLHRRVAQDAAAAAATTSRPRSASESDRLEAEYTKHRLAELIQSGGVAGGPVLPPAGTETSAA